VDFFGQSELLKTPPRGMARQKDRDLAEISRLSSELELSTFLNKGVLQTNSEYKLRIVELERENAVLRVAESRLARTEDRLEAVEKKLEGEREGRRVVEGEREELRERLARAERRLEAIGKLAIREDQNVGPLAVGSLPNAPVGVVIRV